MNNLKKLKLYLDGVGFRTIGSIIKNVSNVSMIRWIKIYSSKVNLNKIII